MTRYRTIVADPPWDNGERPGWSWRKGVVSGSFRGLPYPTMTLDEIAAVPVRALSIADFGGPDRKPRRDAGLPDHDGSHLFLWTTTRYLEAAHGIARGWGFAPTSVLVWCKESRGFSVGGTFQSNVEFVVYARRGSPDTLGRIDTRWFEWPRGAHSAKPEAFIDMVEAICPGPYLELFARRQRLGWDTWGDEALEHVTLGEAADA